MTYGCHNKPRATGYWAQTLEQRNPCTPERVWVWIKDTMSKECQYRRHAPDDKRCQGCNNP